MIFETVLLTIKLASLTTIILLLIGIPLSWWLAFTHNKLKPVIEALVAIPLVLPPTVLGFYLMILLGSNGFLGQASQYFTGVTLAFTFTGLVIASVLYSMPFVIQPLQAAFEKLDDRTIEAAYLLGANKLRVFYSIVVPMSRRGFLTAIILGFSHTVGEFGVVLMVGGNIPGETQVVSIAIYELVESLEYESAHQLSFGLMLFSFVVLYLVYASQSPRRLANNRPVKNGLAKNRSINDRGDT